MTEKAKWVYPHRQAVAQKADEEGLGYFIMHYESANSMPDEELKRAFLKAQKALEEFEKLLPEVDYAITWDFED